MNEINYSLIVFAALVAVSSPGPATLAIAGISMNNGRICGCALASGILTGSLFWSCLAAFGLGALMLTNAWVMEVMRYTGAAYLLYLAYKSARTVFKPHASTTRAQQSSDATKDISLSGAYLRGLLIHLTNPKAILFFGSLYSVGIPGDANIGMLVRVILTVGCVSALVFFGYAVGFSNARVRKFYLRSARVFNTAFALFFGVAGFRLLVSKMHFS